MVLLSACGSGEAAHGVRVGLITPGSIADAAWNSGAHEGLQLIRDSLGLAVSHVEARTPSEQDEALRAVGTLVSAPRPPSMQVLAR